MHIVYVYKTMNTSYCYALRYVTYTYIYKYTYTYTYTISLTTHNTCSQRTVDTYCKRPRRCWIKSPWLWSKYFLMPRQWEYSLYFFSISSSTCLFVTSAASLTTARNWRVTSSLLRSSLRERERGRVIDRGERKEWNEAHRTETVTNHDRKEVQRRAQTLANK